MRPTSFVLGSLLIFLGAPAFAFNPSDTVSSGPLPQPQNELPLPDLSPQPCSFPSLVGKKESEIDRATFGKRPLRIFHKGDPVTMDYAPARINIMLDPTDRVIEITCG